MGLRLRVSPELRCENSGINGEALFVPSSLIWTWPFDRSASTLLGLAVRPGYRRTVHPLIGVEWEAAPTVRVRVGFPETKLLWLARPEWRAYAGLNWRSDTYDLNDESRYGRDALTVEDYRLAAGVSHSLSEQLQVFAEIGGFLKRDYLFEGGQREYGEGSEAGEVSSSVEADRKLYLRVGLAGPF
jgi:hypothetical protein